MAHKCLIRKVFSHLSSHIPTSHIYTYTSLTPHSILRTSLPVPLVWQCHGRQDPLTLLKRQRDMMAWYDLYMRRVLLELEDVLLSRVEQTQILQ